MDNQKVLKDYVRKCKADGSKKRTIETALYTLNPFLEWCGDRDLKELTKDDVYDYLDELEKYKFKRSGKEIGYSEGTLYRIKSVLKKFLSFVTDGLGDVITLKHTNNEKHPTEILTQEEIENLINVCITPRDRAMIATFYESGARKGEMLSVKIRHLIFDGNGAILDIPKGKTGSRRIRLVLASSYLHTWMDCHPMKPKDENSTVQKDIFKDAALFCSLSSPYNTISPTGLADQLHVLADRAGISRKRVYPHAFRHARATHLAEHLTEQQLKEYLGWKKASQMAAVYVHISGKDMDKAILGMHGIVSEEGGKDSLKVSRCPRCKDLNPESAQFCAKCGLPFNIDFDENNIDLLSHPELVQQLVELMVLMKKNFKPEDLEEDEESGQKS